LIVQPGSTDSQWKQHCTGTLFMKGKNQRLGVDM
jgi:hypothetical protein